MKSLGLFEAGYTRINLDDCYASKNRSSSGEIVAGECQDNGFVRTMLSSTRRPCQMAVRDEKLDHQGQETRIVSPRPTFSLYRDVLRSHRSEMGIVCPIILHKWVNSQ